MTRGVLDAPPGRWTDHAACGLRADLMTAPFHEAGDPAVRRTAEWAAKTVCNACPVLIECRWWALHNEVAGICGGFTERERESWRRDFGIVAAPTETLPFLPIDVACRDLLDDGLDPGEVVVLVVERGYPRRVAEAHVNRARQGWREPRGARRAPRPGAGSASRSAARTRSWRS